MDVIIGQKIALSKGVWMNQYTKKQFAYDMKRGLGRTSVELDKCLRRGDSIERYRSIVLYGCRHNLSLDTQSEGTRAEYMYRLQQRFQDDKYFETPVIADFKIYRSSNSWQFSHLSELLLYFAKAGSEEAKSALYQKYFSMYENLSSRRHLRSMFFHERDDFESLCVTLTSLDRFDAFSRIIGDLGRLFEKNKLYDGNSFDWFYFYSKSEFGEKRVENYFKKQSKKSTSFEKYYFEIQKCLENTKHRTEEIEVQPISAEDIINLKGTDINQFIIMRRFSRNADRNELLKLAKAAVDETEPERKSQLLKAFTYSESPFPLDCTIIIEYALSENDNLSNTAFRVLENIVCDKAHDFAIELLSENKNATDAIGVLAKNYRKSDKELFISSIKKIPIDKKDNSGWHGVFFGIQDMFALDRCKDAPCELLKYMYDHTLCSSCRYYTVTEMARRRMLTEDQIQECLHDSYDDTRIYAKRRMKKHG